MASLFMLDTDVCSYLMKGASKELEEALIAHQNETICISVITYAELTFGILNRQSKKPEKKLEQLPALVRVMDWTDSAARRGDFRQVSQFLPVDTHETVRKMGVEVGAFFFLHESRRKL